MIIHSILDNDLYKFTMQYAAMQSISTIAVRYEFINRGNTKFPNGFDTALRKEVNNMAGLRLKDDEAEWMNKTCPYLPVWYINWLKKYRFHPEEVNIKLLDEALFIKIQGPWISTILWEVPLMAMISELYFKMTKDFGEEISRSVLREHDQGKIKKASDHNLKFADFGTRRRFSFENHDNILFHMMETRINEFKNTLIGTSNLYFARKYILSPKGTQAHEWFMVMATLYGYKRANKIALNKWIDVYQGDLGIALTDTFTTDVFLRDFDPVIARIYDGVRQDSGDPILFANKIEMHYRKNGIDPSTKTIIFSDGLDIDKAIDIQKHCQNIGIRCTFGIGTSLTNNVGYQPLNIVIKMTACKDKFDAQWIPAIKLSDVASKHTGSTEEIERAKEALKIKE